MRIFDIKRYSINDGPGIRITIFLKGCPLSCVWCHNPEGILKDKVKMYTQNRCIGCELCIKACKQNALSASVLDNGRKTILTNLDKCIVCGECAKICPTKAMEIVGEDMDLESIMKQIRKEVPFFRSSDGGVTICGGEPLMQKDSLLEILKRCKEEGYHTCVDTTLFSTRAIVSEVAEHCDMFLVDLKIMNSCLHKKFTGVPNESILENLEYLFSIGKDIIVRIPVIEGVNAFDENLEETAEFLFRMQQEYLNGDKIKVELLPYHDIAKGKHGRMGTTYNPNKVEMQVPSPEIISKIGRAHV